MDADNVALLENLVAECRLRFPGAELTSVDGTPARLYVHLPQGAENADGVAEMIIGITADAPDDTLVEAFAAEVAAARGRLRDRKAIAELVCDGVAPTEEQVRFARRHLVRLVPSGRQFQRRGPLPARRAVDFSDFVRKQTAQLRADALRLGYDPDRYVEQQFTYIGPGEPIPQPDLLRSMMDWMAEDRTCFVLLVCDAGLGKTFLLRELARELGEHVPDVQPLLVRLTAHQDIEPLARVVRIELQKHGNSTGFSDQEFESVLHGGQIALLLDGFDELADHSTLNTAYTQLRSLTTIVGGRAKVVIAARAQHFDNLDWVDPLVEPFGPDSRIVAISRFDDDQIRDLIELTLRDADAADRALERLRKVPWLFELCRNPRMLILVMDELATDPANLLDQAADDRPAGLLRHVVERWLAQESRRSASAGKQPRLNDAEVFAALVRLACYDWIGRGYRPHGGLGFEALNAATQEPRPAPPPSRWRRHSSHADHVPQVDEEAIHVLASGTLLVREGRAWRFISPVIEQYLVAWHIAQSLPRGDQYPHRPVGYASAEPVRGGTARDRGNQPRAHRQDRPDIETAELLAAHPLTAVMVDVLNELARDAIRGWADSVPKRADGHAADNAALILARD